MTSKTGYACLKRPGLCQVEIAKYLREKSYEREPEPLRQMLELDEYKVLVVQSRDLDDREAMRWVPHPSR